MCHLWKTRRLNLTLGAAWIAAFAWTASAEAQNEVGPAPVIEATVYLSGAEVTREVIARVPQGASTVAVVRFPDSVKSSDVRVSSGDPSVQIGSMTIATRNIDVEGDTEALDQQLAVLEDRLFELDQIDKDRAAMRSFLAAAVETKTRQGTEGDPADELDPNSIMAIYGLMESRFDELLADRLARRKERRGIEAQVDEVEQERDDAMRTEAVRVAQVQVRAERAGEVPIRFHYLVSEAQWAPRYRASLDDDGNVELIAEAAVRQWTAEDWSDARLRLTTVTPSKRLGPPYLGTWLIQAIDPVAPNAPNDPWSVSQSLPGVTSDRINVGGNQAGQQSAYVAPKANSESAARSQSLEAVSTRHSVTYDVIGRPSLPGDGQTRQVGLWREHLPATVSYRVKPSLVTEAYLEAAILVPEKVPLLGGLVRIYAGESWLGDARLPETPPGANLILPFGVDKRVQVTRRTLDVPTELKVRKHKVIAHAFRTTITNLSPAPIKLVLEERRPVSEDERVQVTTWENRTTAGADPSKTRRGVWLWKLDIPSGESMDVNFAFNVQYPSEIRLSGVE